MGLILMLTAGHRAAAGEAGGGCRLPLRPSWLSWRVQVFCLQTRWL